MEASKILMLLICDGRILNEASKFPQKIIFGMDVDFSIYVQDAGQLWIFVSQKNLWGAITGN